MAVAVATDGPQEPPGCRCCAFRRHPGSATLARGATASPACYCVHEAAPTPVVYGLLHELPADAGASCQLFRPDHYRAESAEIFNGEE